MTTANLFQFLIDFLVICAITCGICHRDAVIRFERKVWSVIKALFLATRDVIKDAQNKKKPVAKSNVIKFENYDISDNVESNLDLEIGVA